MTLCDPHDPEAIARKHAALRRLAASLVSVPDDADDVVQDTWLAALSQRGDRIRNPDGWLQRVARYQAARRRRVDAQRRERELRVARSVLLPEPECQPASERLLQAIEGLRDPYRTVVRLRFEEQLSPEAIAARLDRPLTTVKSQLRRALEQIRGRLPGPERVGDRRFLSWLWPSFWSRGLGRERSALVLAGLVAAVCVLVLVPARRRVPDSVPQSTAIARLAPEIEEELAMPDAAPGTDASGVAQRSALDALPPVRAGALEVAGRVVDGKGAPVAGTPIFVGTRGHTADATIAATSDADGCFLLSDVDPEAWISADGDGWIPSGWASVRASASPSDARVELSLRVAKATTRFVGFVHDPNGRPIHGARFFHLEEALAAWFHQGGPRMAGIHPGPTSAIDGTFELDANTLTLQLLVIAPGFAPALVGVVVPKHGDLPLSVELEPGAVLRGRVSRPNGAAAANAEVQFRPDAPLPPSTVRADAEGTFELVDLAEGWGRSSSSGRMTLARSRIGGASR